MKLIFALMIALAGLAGIGCAEYWNNPPPTPESNSAPIYEQWRESYVPRATSAVETPRETTPAPVNLLTTNIAPLWVLLTDGEFFLTVNASAHFNLSDYELVAMVDGKRYCNHTRIYADDGPVELTCQAEERRHGSVQRVSAQTPRGDLRCERNIKSTAETTMFACDWR